MATIDWTIDQQALTCRVTLSSFNTSQDYSIGRVFPDYPDDDLRKYEAVAHRKKWSPNTDPKGFTDYEPPVGKTFRYRLWKWDASPFNPANKDGDWGPGFVDDGESSDVLLAGDQMVLRSMEKLGLYTPVCLIKPYEAIEWPLRSSVIPVIGSAFPVVVHDRRDGRTGSMTILASDQTNRAKLHTMLGLDTHKTSALWLRAPQDDALLYDDLYFQPLRVSATSFERKVPQYRRYEVEFVEIDPGIGYRKRPGDDDS